MRLLLTSSGISNPSIQNALVELLGKPISDASALCIPTGVQPFPGGPSHVYRFISGGTLKPMCGLGWKSLGVLELTALPSIGNSGVRNRRSDRHQGRRRHSRSRLRGELEAVQP